MNTPPTPNPLPLKGGKGFFAALQAHRSPHNRVPREGGDPDPFAQAVRGLRTHALAGNARQVSFKPPPPASFLGAKRRSNLGDHLFRSASVPWVASLRSQ